MEQLLDLRSFLAHHTGAMLDTVERQFGDLKVVIDRGTCISTENCIALAPELFEFDDDQICRFKQDTGTVDRDTLIEACRICPVDALSVIDASGKQLVP